MAGYNRMTQFKRKKLERIKKKQVLGLYIPYFMAADTLYRCNSCSRRRPNNTWSFQDIGNKFNLDLMSPNFLIASEPLIQKKICKNNEFKRWNKNE